jgi:hypothetical protein
MGSRPARVKEFLCTATKNAAVPLQNRLSPVVWGLTKKSGSGNGSGAPAPPETGLARRCLDAGASGA